MHSDFDKDIFPARPKILFIGWPESSHTHSWIDLLEGRDFNVRLFCLPSAEPPENWAIKSYLTRPGAGFRDTATRRTVSPPSKSYICYVAYLIRAAQRRSLFAGRAGLSRVANWVLRAVEKLSGGRCGASLPLEDDALAKVIRDWRPDVIHTLGFDAASYLYLRVRKTHRLEGIGSWVAQARGGPDIALQRYSPEFLPLITEVFATCDHFIADNEPNYTYALSAGLSPEKISNPGMGVVSGAGGMDVDAMRSMWSLPPSQRERVIVWPKAYETYTAKAMPVFEAILKVWNRIQPCRIEMLWMDQSDVKIWYEKLFSPEIKQSCPIFGRLSREETLARIANARVLLAPSLSDGVPNTMMEAMALGAVPLVSPLDTIVPVVRDEENVLFARNLYPDEIAEALLRLMSDDDLVDRMAQNNLVRIREFADRNDVKKRALVFYEEVARQARIAPHADGEK